MSFMDTICQFWNNVDVSSAVLAQTNEFLDLETSDGSIVNGEQAKQLGTVYWNVQVDVAATVATDVSFKLITSAANSFTTPTILAAIGDSADPLIAAQLTLGKCWSIQIPMERCLQFVGCEKVGASGTALVVSSWLGMEPLTDKNIQKYPT